ncbi:MAG: tetratricopeptide repeat protein [Thiohalomonadales bacterium]
MPVRHESHENLVTLLAIAVVFAMVALVSRMVEQYSVPMILPVEPVEGYVRPQSQAAKAEALTAMAHRKPQIKQRDMKTIKTRFDQAVALLHSKQYEYAITALDEVLKLQDDMPEVYVNMGYAYFGLKQYPTAISAFQRAIDLRPEQTNAYFGLAKAYEENNEIEAALGAMRTYIHLSDPKDKFLPKARAAIWEWEASLGRIKGIKPAPQPAEPLRPPLLDPQPTE